MRPTLVVAVFGLLALVTLGWFWLRQDLGPAPLPDVPVTAPAGAADGNARSAAGAVVDAEPGRAVQPQAQGAAERVAVSSEAGASAVVHGRLVDGRAQPRAGVELRMDTWSIDNGFDFLPASVLPAGARERPHATARTAADGTFTLMLEKGHRGVLSLPDDDLVFAAEAPRVDAAEGLELGDLTVLRAATIAGLVKDEFGKPLADVKVAAHGSVLGFGNSSSATTDGDGRFRLGKLKEGTWHLRTATAQYLPAAEKITLAAEEQRTDVVLALARGAAISGQVVDDRGAPVTGAKVAAQRQEERGGVRIERFAAAEAAVTDEAGYFTLAGLEGETATIRAFGGGHGEAIAAGVAIGTGDLVLTVPRLGVIEGILVGGDGRPIGGSEVSVRRDLGVNDAAMVVDEPLGMPMFDMPSRVRTAADGSFRVEGVRPGAVVLSAEGQAHRPVRLAGISIAPAQVVTGIRLVADAGATAVVQVVDTEGKPVADAKVSVQREAAAPENLGGAFGRAVRAEVDSGDFRIVGGDEALGMATTDAEGRAVVRALPAGRLEFSASHEQHAAARPVVVAMPAAGQVEATLTLRTPGFVDVSVVGADGAAAAGARFTIEGPLGAGEPSRQQSGTADAQGRAHVGPLVPGDYTAVLVRDNQPQNVGGAMVFVGHDSSTIDASQRSFRIVAGDTTVIDLRKPMAVRLHGKVLGAEGAVAGCHVELQPGEADAPHIPGFGGRTVACDGSGEYEFVDVEPGNYVLRYGREDSVVKAHFELQVHGEEADVNQDLYLRTGTVRVQAVVAGTQEPLGGATVELSEARSQAAGAPRTQRVMMMTLSMNGNDSAEATSITMGEQRTRTGADGWAQIDDVPVGAYDVKVTHDKYAEGKREGQQVGERQVTDVGRVELSAAGRMSGKVTTADGSSLPIALVEYRRDGTEDRETQPAMGGKFSFTSLTPGRYLVRARSLPMGPGESGPWSEDVAVEVKAGEAATADVRLPAR